MTIKIELPDGYIMHIEHNKKTEDELLNHAYELLSTNDKLKKKLNYEQSNFNGSSDR